ncbi:MAG: Gfo/Idh/MocA family oxidoreductase [Verrucomicrobiota bacterium]
MSQPDDARELKAVRAAEVAAPQLSYQPPVPQQPVPKIGLIGCGGIARNHLDAYRARSYPVAVLCDIHLESAQKLRDEFFPEAEVTSDVDAVFTREDIRVLDLATHPDHRQEHIHKALRHDKHVLSQKPFVTDLDAGRELVQLAKDRGLKLAVNQNGRWAPYYAYLREVVAAGLLGEIVSCDIHIAWDHSWIKGTRFEEIHHIVLYDFAIHWFDMVRCVFGEREGKQIFAQIEPSRGQELAPPLSAHSVMQFDGGQASLVFHAHTRFAPAESTIVTGTRGTFRSSGPVCANDQIRLTTEAGEADVQLTGNWFNDGFAGTMGELLCAIEENREPSNSAAHNLRSLEYCFAAVNSANTGQPVVPGTVTTLDPG